MKKSERRLELYRVSIEIRNKQHKLSLETKHFEALFGVVKYIGDFDENLLINILSSFIPKDYSKALTEDILKRKTIRLYITYTNLLRMLKLLGISPAETALYSYEYILVLEPT